MQPASAHHLFVPPGGSAGGSARAVSRLASTAPAPPGGVLAAAAAPGTAVATGLDLIFDRLDEAADAQVETNRSQSRLWASLAELMRLARANPHVYLRPSGLAHRDALAFAEDAAAFDVGLRLNLSAGQVRNLAHQAQELEERMPALRAAFAAGATTALHASSAVDLLAGWVDPAGVAAFDRQVVELATTLTVAKFRKRAHDVKRKLVDEPEEARHARAFTDRRAWIEPADDGMAFFHAYLAAPDAMRIAARLNATARAEQKKVPVADPAWRNRDQIRTDLAVSWLAGDGTPTAAKVRPILLVPMLSLTGEGDEPPFTLR